MTRRLKELAPGIELVPKQTRATETWLWVGICAPSGSLGDDRADVSVLVSDHEPRVTSLTRYRYLGDEQFDFFHGHLRIDGLIPATVYDVTVTPTDPSAPTLDARCRFTTLPTSVGEQPIRIAAASCFDLGTDASRQLPGLCEELFGDHPPELTLLLGDQVYLDAPWWEFRRRTKVDPRKFYLTKYWSAWGRDADGHGGLSPLLASGGNWFLPDDHEFWNNFPHATPLALHSMRNWRNIIRDRAERTWSWVGSWITGEHSIPPELVMPPKTTEWDTWSRAAFELFGSFQTPAPNGAVSAGDADEAQTDPPRTPIVQHVDIGGDVRIVMLDTRTQRSRSAKSDGSAFVPRPDLDRFIELVGAPELALVALAQPAFQPPTPYDHFGHHVKAFVDFDRGMENYRVMYPEFWQRLVEARAGRPTVFIGGDVHYNEVAIAPSIGVAQVVSSPMSLVSGLADIRKMRTNVLRRTPRRPEVDVGDLIPGRSGEIDWLVDFKSDHTEGLSTLDLSRSDGVYRLRVEHHRRKRWQRGLLVDLTIDPSAPLAEQITGTRIR